MKNLPLVVMMATVVSGWGDGGTRDVAVSKQPGTTGLRTVVAPQLDLSAVVRQVHFAWRQSGDAWTSSHSTYRAKRTEEALEFVPVHDPGARDDVVTGAPVRLGNVVIARGGRVLTSDGARFRNDAQGRLMLDASDFSQEYESSEAGVEMRWQFDTAPAGRGPLEVKLPVLAGRLRDAASDGLHFEAAGLLVRVSHGTWVDAAGARTAVPVVYEKGAVVLRVPADLLASSSYPAVLDPLLEPELAIGRPVYGPKPRRQEFASIACGASSCLVVWQDEGGDYQPPGIYGARVDAAGNLLDEDALFIDIGGSTPVVASDGTNYLVVWAQGESIRGARVTAAGVMLDGTWGFGIRGTTAASPAVAWGGTNYLVTWTDFHDGYPDSVIEGARVSAAGVVLDPSGLIITSTDGGQNSSAVAGDGTNFLVTWRDLRSGCCGLASGDIYGARVTAAGVVLDPGGLAISTTADMQDAPALAFDGTNYLVAWSQGRDGGELGRLIRGARVSAAGTVLDSSGLAISTGEGEDFQPAVGWTGASYLVTWGHFDRSKQESDLVGARVGPSGAVVDTTPFAISTAIDEQFNPKIARSGTNVFVTWTDIRNDRSTDIYLARVAAGGTVLDPAGVLVTRGMDRLQFPDVARAGANYLVVWEESHGDAFDIIGARVSASGEVLDPTGLPISTVRFTQRRPAVASNGTDYFVTWWDSRGGSVYTSIYGARVSGSGAVLDPGGLPISTQGENHESPAVAWNGTNYLVTWKGSGAARSISGSRVSAAGVVLDPNGLTISTDRSYKDHLAIASDGTDFFVTWMEARDATSAVVGARVSAAGVVLDPAGIALGAGTDQYYPAVAWGGSSYFVVWQDGYNDIRAARVSPSGALLDAGVVGTDAGTRGWPAVAWDGTSFFVAWEEGFRPCSPPSCSVTPIRIRGTWVDATGAPTGNSVTLSHSFTAVPRLACESNRCLVAWAGAGIAARFLTATAGSPHPPVANSMSVTTTENTAVTFTLTGNDPDGDRLVFGVLSYPNNGSFWAGGQLIRMPTLTYTPRAGFIGSETLSFVASDGTSDSAPAEVVITVTRAEPDAGTDAGTSDAGAGGVTGGGGRPESGCGCSSSGDSSCLLLAFFAVLSGASRVTLRRAPRRHPKASPMPVFQKPKAPRELCAVRSSPRAIHESA